MSFLDIFRAKSDRVNNHYTKPTIIIPAYNEEQLIRRTIDLVKSTGLDVNILVVNDGSTDNTAGFARSRNVDVISLPRNLGKTAAFFLGVRFALKEYSNDAIVVLDADLVNVPRKSLELLINNAIKTTKERKIRMFVGNQFERVTKYSGKKSYPGFSSCPEGLVGIRSFSIPAAYKLMASQFRSLPRRFAIEYFLNDYFADSLVILKNAKIYTENAIRTESGKKQQEELRTYSMSMIGLKRSKREKTFEEFRRIGSPLRARLR